MYAVKKRSRDFRKPRNIEEILNETILRRYLFLAGHRNATVQSIHEIRQFIVQFLKDALFSAVNISQYHKRTRILLADIQESLSTQGITTYGFDDQCVIQENQYHITEVLTESNTKFIPRTNVDDKGQFLKTDLVRNANILKENEEEVEGDGSEVEEEWKGFDTDTSDEEKAESDTGEESREMIEVKNNDSLHESDTESELKQELRNAQEMLDDQLIITNQGKLEDEDRPLGEGALSEEEFSLPISSFFNEIDELWEYYEDLSCFQLKETNLENIIESLNSSFTYVFSRRNLYELIDRICYDSFTVHLSSVALSCLHNTLDQHIHHELSFGALSGIIRSQVFALLHREERELRIICEKRNKELLDTNGNLNQQVKMLKEQIKVLKKNFNVDLSPESESNHKNSETINHKKRSLEDQEKENKTEASATSSVLNAIRKRFKSKGLQVHPSA